MRVHMCLFLFLQVFLTVFQEMGKLNKQNPMSQMKMHWSLIVMVSKSGLGRIMFHMLELFIEGMLSLSSQLLFIKPWMSVGGLYFSFWLFLDILTLYC